MKTWLNAELKEISISATANGGDVSMNFDNSWFDANGALVVTFVDPSLNS